MAFSIAGSMAFKDAMRKADPIITEPIMKVAVIVPDEYLGDVIGDVYKRQVRCWPTALQCATAKFLWVRTL